MQMTLAPTLSHPNAVLSNDNLLTYDCFLCVYSSSIGLRIANMHKLLRDRLDLSKHILVPV